MNIETKFSIGDTVYKIYKSTENIYEKCPACDGKLHVRLKDGHDYPCPSCGGKSIILGQKTKHEYEGPFVITRIRIIDVKAGRKHRVTYFGKLLKYKFYSIECDRPQETRLEEQYLYVLNGYNSIENLLKELDNQENK